MADKTTLQYTAEHEWVLVDGDTATVGITAYAADKLGDVVFVDLPAVGTERRGRRSSARSSRPSRSASSSPRSTARSPRSTTPSSTTPELVNSDPFGDGWLIKVTLHASCPRCSRFDEYTALVGE